ncbi:hypothetical protein [Vibrio panuliri]|uniref:hypothetical protein n=1 Tax=Vibrio panuliri TaxID=1381081 RepID=UPI000B100C0C|nr:hypothetical protein [Vibrio panuliri]
MFKLVSQLKAAVHRTRREWAKEAVYGYRIHANKLWKYYGYTSKQEMQRDLQCH